MKTFSQTLLWLALCCFACLVVSAPCPAAAQPLSEAARWLQGYLRVDTSNPPGNEHLAAAYLANLLRQEGIAAELLVTPEGRTNLYARLRARGPKAPGGALLLVHHMDVVSPGRGWTRPAFTGDVTDGVLWGRGAVDVKSLGIAHLAAFLALHRSGAALSRDVVLLGVADEESGGLRGTAWLLEHRRELFADVGAVLNEGGANPQVLGRLLWWGIEVAQKRPLWLRVTASGRAGHASGLNPNSASHRLIEALGRLLAMPFEYRVTAGARNYLRALAPLHNEKQREVFANVDNYVQPSGPTRNLLPGMVTLFLDTPQITVLEASDRINSVAATASAEIDVRLLPDTDTDTFLARVRKALGTDVEVEVLLSAPPGAPSPTDTPLYRLLERELVGEGPVVPAFISGFTDSRYFRQQGIVAYGFSPFLLEGEILRGIHGADERIPLAAFDAGVERMIRVVRSYCVGATSR